MIPFDTVFNTTVLRQQFDITLLSEIDKSFINTLYCAEVDKIFKKNSKFFKKKWRVFSLPKRSKNFGNFYAFFLNFIEFLWKIPRTSENFGNFLENNLRFFSNSVFVPVMQ